MSRSPLAYPLTRGVDGDAGGSADLQTDIMRFMAILALCLVAIFALVQSIPLQPAADPPVVAQAVMPAQPAADSAAPPAVAPPAAVAHRSPAREPRTANVALTRPKWTPQLPVPNKSARPVPNVPTRTVSEATPVREPASITAPPAIPDRQGFTLRFESDLALTRLVAAQQVGLYAIEAGRAQRMTVLESRISFWDASHPNRFHEMEAATVPAPVRDALARTGADTAAVSWGVTLPGKLRRQLDALLRENSGGTLVIASDGNLRLEAS